MTGPLEDVRVLDLTRLLPGGYATLLMADLGADVVKVEQPQKGDYVRWSPPMMGGHSAAHIALNRNKRSLTINLKTDGGRALLLDLVEQFDVLIESFRPGVMERLGIGYEALRARNPGLVYCAISGYGQDGPRAQTAGHDVNYIGYGGLLSIVGAEGQPPVIPGVQIGDLAGGGMAGVIAVLAALVRRAKTGEGDYCDISMMDGALSWLTIHAAEFFATGGVPQRELMTLSGAFPCYRVYRAADGWLTVGALEPQFWAALCDALERPDLTDDAFAVGGRRSEVLAELEELFSKRTRSDWMSRFEGRDVCVGPVNDFAEAFVDDQVLHRDMVVEAEVPGVGEFRHVGNPIKMTSAPKDLIRRSPPGLGEHTDEILEQVGIGEADRGETSRRRRRVMPNQLPDDIKMQLVDLVGAYLRHTPSQDLPKKLRRLAGFRPKALARHSDELIVLLDDEVERKLILQALDDDALRLPKRTEAVGRIVLERPEGWEGRIAGMSELPDEPEGAPARDYEAELLRERRKSKSAREEARKAKASARAEVEREQRKLEELQRELGAVAARLEVVTAERDLARAEVERVRDELRRDERRVQRSVDKAKLAEGRARAEAKALRKDVARLGRKLDAFTVAPGPRPPKVPAVDATPGTWTALQVPKGLFAESPETLDSWLQEPKVSLLIDGYNVSKTESGFGSLSLEDQRTRLIDEIARLGRARKVPATIVFDGAVIEPGTTRRARRTVKVAYSKPPEIADDHLVALLHELPRHPVIVVTDDRELQQRCMALGATIATAKQLLGLIR